MKSSIHAVFWCAIPAMIAISAAIFFQNKILAITLLVMIFVLIGLGVAIPQMKFFGNFICSGDKSKKQIALTFDDGPDENSTPALLDLLREAKIETAFFCIGKKVAANPELSARIVREGHLLQNHSYAHSPFTNFLSVARLRTELSQTQTAVQKATGVVPQFFRPPMGLSNPRIFCAARELDLKVIGWTIRSLDTISTDPKKIVARISRRLEPGAIILLHDGNIPAARLLATVKLLLENLRERGYDVVRLDKLLE
jgi:peptidoglycan/xylan/chitin deacetylase (PgdA/CDA1 family)